MTRFAFFDRPAEHRCATLWIAAAALTLSGCSRDISRSVEPTSPLDGGQVPRAAVRWSAGPEPGPLSQRVFRAVSSPTIERSLPAVASAGRGMAAGFSADLGAFVARRSDVVWQHSGTGDRGIWRLVGSTFDAWVPIGVVDPSWQIGCVAHLTGDATDDLVWTNTNTGERAVWGMTDGQFSTYAGLPSTPAEWQISACGDVNEDGWTDLLFTNTSTGERGAWLMNGTNVTGWLSWGVVPLEWRLIGVADIGNDLVLDLVWSNTSTGDRGAWTLSGVQPVGWRGLGNVEPSWQLLGVRSFDDDTEADLFWRYGPTGETGFWRLVSGAFAGWAGGPGAPAGWEFGGMGSLFSSSAPPVATTPSATNPTATSLQLNAAVNPNGFAASAWFEWGTSAELSGASSTEAVSVGSGTASVPISASLSGLTCGVTYYFRTVAERTGQAAVRGAIASASTSACPVELPDLIGTDVTLMGAYTTRGQVASVLMTVKNVGTAWTGLAASFRVSVYMSFDLNVGEDAFLCEAEVGRLFPQESKAGVCNFMVPTHLNPGDYFVYVVIDSGTDVLESDEGNNVAFYPTFVRIM